MKKEDFLEILRDYLKKDFSEDEVMDILRDYEEYFVDGIIEGKSEIDIIQSLGSPKEIANELLAESNIKNENKVKGKVESFFIEAKGKFKSRLNKFKVNLNDKEHVKSRKKIELLQILLTIILLPFAFAIVLVLPNWTTPLLLVVASATLITPSLTVMLVPTFAKPNASALVFGILEIAASNWYLFTASPGFVPANKLVIL